MSVLEDSAPRWTARVFDGFWECFAANDFDRHVKTNAEAATVGIVLCQKKHKAQVEITLPKDANLHARQYPLYLPSKEERQQKRVEWAGIEGENSV